jgi:hypothetical protein
MNVDAPGSGLGCGLRSHRRTVITRVLAGLCAVSLAACTIGRSGVPPVDIATVRIPVGIEGERHYRKGLDPALLPGQLAGRTVREETIFTRTTEYGFRAVLAMYDRVVLMMWKAPVDADLEAGLVYDNPEAGRGAVGATRFLRSIMEGRPEEPGAYYSRELVSGSGSNEVGLQWFTTEGHSTLLWQVPKTQRSSFWFRSGVWFFGIEADDHAVRDRAARDLVEHLQSLEVP